MSHSSPGFPKRVTKDPDLYIGISSIALGLAASVYSLNLPKLGDGKLGPGLFPTLIGGGLFLLGCVVVFGTIRNKTAQRSVVQSETTTSDENLSSLSLHKKHREDDIGRRLQTVKVGRRRAVTNGLSVVGLIFAYIFLVEILGYQLTLSVICSLLMKLLGASWKQSVIVAIAIVAVLWALFEKMLMVQLPDGLLW